MADESYGTLLVGRVGKIEIHADGEQRKAQDLSEWLTAYRDGEHARWKGKKASAKSWWRARLRERHAAGLSLGAAKKWLEEVNEESEQLA